jgi:hypothetical protein
MRPSRRSRSTARSKPGLSTGSPGGHDCGRSPTEVPPRARAEEGRQPIRLHSVVRGSSTIVSPHRRRSLNRHRAASPPSSTALPACAGKSSPPANGRAAAARPAGTGLRPCRRRMRRGNALAGHIFGVAEEAAGVDQGWAELVEPFPPQPYAGLGSSGVAVAKRSVTCCEARYNTINVPFRCPPGQG